MLPRDFVGFVRDVLEPDILPVYRMPYQGRRGPEPRTVHGCLHVSRCVILAEMMLNGYRTLGVPDSRFDPLAIRLALAWHDAGREGDGTDEWEPQSAALAAQHACRLGLSPTYGQYVGSLIIHHQRRMTDPNAWVVQSCDTLDVLRVYPGRSFERHRLGFLNPVGDPCLDAPPTGLRDRLIAEAEAWIDHTESFSIRRTIGDSPTCCQDLLQTLNDVAYPTLTRLLSDSIQDHPGLKAAGPGPPCLKPSRTN